MNILDFFGYSFAALKDRKARSALTILMVIVGAALLASMNGMSAGMNNFIDKQFSLLSPNVLMVTPAPIMEQGASNPVTLTQGTADTLRNIDGVLKVFPSITRSVKIQVGGRTLTTFCMGMDPEGDAYIVPTARILEGSETTAYDSIGITLGYDVYSPPGEKQPIARVGQVVTLQYQYVKGTGITQEVVTEERNFVVRGVWEKSGAGSMLNLDNTVYISLAAANSFLKAGGKYDMIFVVTVSQDKNPQVEAKIREIYGDDIGVTSPKSIIETLQGFIAGFSVFTSGIAAISLVVAGVGVVTTLYTATVERTREIGLLKALGFKNHSILSIFLVEAAIIGIIGASIGLVLGAFLSVALLEGMSGFGFQGISPAFLPEDMVFVWALTVGISSFAGLYPAWRASRLDPVEALRK